MNRHQPDAEARDFFQLRFPRWRVGLVFIEAGAALGVSRAVAYRNWKYARAWLRDALEK